MPQDILMLGTSLVTGSLGAKWTDKLWRFWSVYDS